MDLLGIIHTKKIDYTMVNKLSPIENDKKWYKTSGKGGNMVYEN